MPTILVVDDEESVCEFLREVCEDAGYKVQVALDGKEALASFKKDPPDTVLLDIRMPELDGMQVMDLIHELNPHVPVILMTAFGTTEMAIEAMKKGAFDYIVKPFNLDELLLTVKKAVTVRKLSLEVAALKEEQEFFNQVDALIGRSAPMQNVYKMIGRVADSDVTVLLQGESGTGKEVVARAIHRYSKRRNEPFIKINCATIPENLSQ